MVLRIAPAALAAAVLALAGAGCEPADGGTPAGTAGCTEGRCGDASEPLRCTGPVPLPERLLFGGAGLVDGVSAIAVADVDQDGCLDLATLVLESETAGVRLVVSWGDPEGLWRERWTQSIPSTDAMTVIRDSSSSVISIGDWDRDGALDVATASGVALGGPDRALRWQELPGGGVSTFPLPAILVDLDGDGAPTLLRGSTAGMERCETPTSCEVLALPDCPMGITPCPPTDLVVEDFDGDGRPDFLAGRDLEEDYDPELGLVVRTWRWSSVTGWAVAEAALGMDPVDLESADVDGDGAPDVIAQVEEFISDFPSVTRVWRNTGAGFELLQEIENGDNHSDPMTVADVNGDSFPDRLFIGVDIPQVTLTLGNGSGFSPEKGTAIPAPSGRGVQLLDVNGDGIRELVIRENPTAEGAALAFVPLP